MSPSFIDASGRDSMTSVKEVPESQGNYSGDLSYPSKHLLITL